MKPLRHTVRPHACGPAGPAGFTLVEVITVISIILILAGLVIGTAGYVQKKGATSRAEAEIAALSAALESYRVDNGTYPLSNSTNTGARILYEQLSGDTNNNGINDDTNSKTYFSFHPNMLSAKSGANRTVNDPYGTPYQYLAPGSNNVATFDLWTTTGSTNTARWITNW